MNTDQVEAHYAANPAVAPRVTKDDLEQNIVSIEIAKYVTRTGQVLRWAILNTRSGWSCHGEPSAAVNAENDNAEVGESIAIENAKRNLWPLMGYHLKETQRG